MGLALDLARRTLARHRARTLLSVAGIGVGIATVVGLFVLDHNTLLDRSRSADPDWRAEIEVSPSLSVERPREELRALPGVSRVAAAFQVEARLESVPARQAGAAAVTLVAIEVEPVRSLGAYRVDRGRDLQRLDEVLIGEGLARRRGLEPGARVRLAPAGRAPSRECVDGAWLQLAGEGEDAGSAREFEVAGVLAREGLGRKSTGDVVLVDFAAGSELFEAVHVETRYWLGRDPGVNLERLQQNLGEAWSYELSRSVVIGQAADERAFRNGVRFAGVMALVLGLYVIFHTLSLSITMRVREVGVLHALGATRKQIGQVFLVEALLVAGLGGLAGLVLGLALAKLLLRAGITTVGRGSPIRLLDVPWGPVLALVAAGVGVALVGSIFPLLRARGIDAVQALRGEEASADAGSSRSFRWLAALLLALVVPGLVFAAAPLVGEAEKELVGVVLFGVGVLALFVATPLLAPRVLAGACVLLARPFQRAWPLAGKLAVSGMARAPARVAGGVAGIALVTAGYVGLRGMTASLEAEIHAWGRTAFLDKVFVRGMPRTDFELLRARLELVPGYLGIEPNEARTYVPFLLIGARTEDLDGYGPLAEEPELGARMRAEGGLVLSERLARHRGYELGERVHVRSARGDVLDLPVIAISDAYGYFPHPDERLYAVVDDGWMRRMFCVDSESVTSFSVRLAPGARRAGVQEAVRALHPSAPITFESGPYLYRWHTSDVRRDFILFDILILMTALLAGIGVLNGQLLAALERARELGILRALGVSDRQLAGTVLLEACLSGLLGGLIGAALGSAVAPVVVAALRALSGLPLPLAHAGLALVWGPAGALVLALAAAGYPIHRMRRMGMLEAVRLGGR